MIALPPTEPTVRTVDDLPRPNENASVAPAPDNHEPVGKLPDRCVQCEIHEGLPVIHQRVSSHYVSKPGGGCMLTLERKPGERIRIGDSLDVVVLAIDSHAVRLGLIQPPELLAARRRAGR